MNHAFDGERSGTGETCLYYDADKGGKCYQRESHPVHNLKARPDTHEFEGSDTGNDICMVRLDGISCRQPKASHVQPITPLLGTEDGSYRVIVIADGETALDWQGNAENVGDALSRALDAREDKVRGGDWWKTAREDGGPL